MSISSIATFCQYCKGMLIHEHEILQFSHQECFDEIKEFSESIISDQKFYLLDSDEMIALTALFDLLKKEGSSDIAPIIKTKLLQKEYSHISMLTINFANINNNSYTDFYNQISSLLSNFHYLNKLIISNTNSQGINQILQFSNELKSIYIHYIKLDQVPIPFENQNFQTLENLNLAKNEITLIPIKIIQNLTNLKTLVLSHNNLSNLPNLNLLLNNLHSLHLRNNSFSSYPVSINTLKRLIVLDISYNKLTFLPNDINHLNLLVTLNVSNNQIKFIEDFTADFEFLNTIDFSNNKLKMLPKSISLLSNLKSLNLANNNMKTLPKLSPSITHLNLSGNNLDYISFNDFSHMKNLQYLNLSNNDLNSISESFFKLPKIVEINLSGNTGFN